MPRGWQRLSSSVFLSRRLGKFGGNSTFKRPKTFSSTASRRGGWGASFKPSTKIPRSKQVCERRSNNAVQRERGDACRGKWRRRSRFTDFRRRGNHSGTARRGAARRGSLVKMCRWVIQFAKEGTVVAPLPRVGVGAGRKVCLFVRPHFIALCPHKAKKLQRCDFPAVRTGGRGLLQVASLN